MLLRLLALLLLTITPQYTIRSDNWAGYEVTALLDQPQYTSVRATWIIPAANPNRTDLWVGLGGSLQWDPLIQAGTSEYLPSRKSFAWWAIIDGNPHARIVSCACLQPGEEVTVSVTETTGAIRFTWRAGTWTRTRTVSYPVAPMHTAEAVAEDETSGQSPVTFGSVHFWNLRVNGQSMASYPLTRVLQPCMRPSAFDGDAFTVHAHC